MICIDNFPVLDSVTELIVPRALPDDRRVLLFGEPGSGKSTLVLDLARTLWQAGRRSWCIAADPGFPTFGPPGAVGRGKWQGADWQLLDMEALCTLDAGRFRLPLVAAVRKLAGPKVSGTLFVDAPGVIRGVAGAELLLGLVEAADIDVILVLIRAGSALPLPNELRASGAEVFVVQVPLTAHRPGKRERIRERTRCWDAYLANAEERRIGIAGTPLIGTPPPLHVASAWKGRQIALVDRAHGAVLGEVIAKEGDSLRVRLPPGQFKGSLLLVRDAQRGEEGLLGTARPPAPGVPQSLPPPDIRPYAAVGSPEGPCPVVQVGMVTAVLVNGIFGDPLLHLRLRQQRRSLLFDLGEGRRLPGRIAHQVSDVFISHAHFDHIGGFLWLLRSRIGDLPPCRLYGPPGLAGHIEGLVRGIHWDRVGEYAPRFAVAELHGERLIRFAVQAGRPGVEPIDEVRVTEGIIREESCFQIRAVTLDHGIPVLAFSFEQFRQLHIRKDVLSARGLIPGPWLGELKRHTESGEPEALIQLPNGRLEPAGALADELVLITPGQKLVYATDLADTADNRERLTRLARGAHALFCEATFIEADAAQAARTGHLTARACGEIATAAAVEHLIPFHFSRRYEAKPEQVYAEVRAVCEQTVWYSR